MHVVAAAPAALPGGWTLASDPEDGVSVGVAPGWRQGVDRMLDSTALAGSVAGDASLQGNVDPNNPMAQLGAQMEANDKKREEQELAALRAKGTVINIIDGSKPTIGELRTRYYVHLKDHGGNYSLDKATADEMDHLRGTGANDPVKVNLPIGPAMKIVASRKTVGGDQEDHVSYIVVDGKNSYDLRFESTNNPDVILSIADQVAQTWRIAPSKP